MKFGDTLPAFEMLIFQVPIFNNPEQFKAV